VALQRRSRASAAAVARERGRLAAVVAARRNELGLTQVELGDLAGVSYRIVHNLEAGRTEISLERLLAILDTLGLRLVLDRGAASVVVISNAVAHQYAIDLPDGVGNDTSDES